MTSGSARRVLQGDRSVVPEDRDLVVDGEPVEIRQSDGSLRRPRVGVDPIALDAGNAWPYYGPMSGISFYRIRMADLLDESLASAALAARMERYGTKPLCDGIDIDSKDDIYVTDIGSDAIGVIGPDRGYRVYLKDARLSWPDAFSFGPDSCSPGWATAKPGFHYVQPRLPRLSNWPAMRESS